VGAFGERLFEVIESTPERLTEIVGIGPRRKARIVEGWVAHKTVGSLMVFLHSCGLGTARAARIYKTYGRRALERVRKNPYALALDVPGIGFESADAIARHLGIAGDSPIRARAGVRHVLQALADEGHCAAEREKLARAAERLLGVPGPVVERAIDEELEAGGLVADAAEGRACVYLAPLHRAEVELAGHCLRLLAGEPPWGRIEPAEAIPWVERKAGLALSASQRRAVACALASKVSVITGGPGVGKTTVVNGILGIVEEKGMQIALCAPTGRAAQRLHESTGREASTIHRLLGYTPKQRRFTRNAGNRLRADLIVVDEASMVDVLLMTHLLRAVPDGAGILMVGDADQLPSIGPGAVLCDLIASRRVPVIRLAEIFRQPASSRIVVNAHRINHGRTPRPSPASDELADFYFVPARTVEEARDKLLRIVTERIPHRFGLHPVYDVQVLTPMNRGELGTRSLNLALQQRLNAAATPAVTRLGRTFKPGDKVIQTVNDYEKGVFNGDVGRVAAIELDTGRVEIDFGGRRVAYELGELDELSLGYAITVHKSQGGEYEAVAMPIVTQHYALLERTLLYTAVTRGRRLTVLVGEPRALAMAVKRARSTRRLTNLTARLMHATALTPSSTSDSTHRSKRDRSEPGPESAKTRKSASRRKRVKGLRPRS